MSKFALQMRSMVWVAIVTTVLLTSSQATQGQESEKRLRVLIVDGQNNHGDWPKITAMVKSYLVESKMFEVDVVRTQFLWKGEKWLKDYSLDDGKKYQSLPKAQADPDFKPDFSKYDAVISNFGYGAAPWPESTQKAFTQFIRNGGGFLSIHAADNSFPAWREYNEMIGIGGWGGRNERSGPYVYMNDKGEVIRDKSKGSGGSHGPQREFPLVLRDTEHPITKGMPSTFMHARDELYERLRGPAVNMKILATAMSMPNKKNGSAGRHEPMLMTISFGKGRIVHTTLGHADYSVECVGMITILLRGTEWAATGKVTQPLPEDFPTAEKSSSRKFNQ